MNHAEYPSLNDAVTGFVFQNQEPGQSSNVDRKKLETCCIDFISKLESRLAKAREMPHDDFIDESSEIGRNLLEVLENFSGEFFVGKTGAQINEEINRAKTVTYTYEAVLKTRPLTNAVIRTFWKIEESKNIRASHSQLGEALVRACAVTFYHVVMLVGLDSDFGSEIDQSTVVFVNELKQAWNTNA